MNFKVVLNTIGWVLIIEAACLVLPLVCALVYGESILPLLISALLCLLIGVPLTLLNFKNKIMYAKEGFVTVALSWITISVMGALPFVISGYIPNFIDAFFETASGFSTTGASVLSDVEVLPKSLLFWRSFTHWIGGMGVLVFLVALLPLSGGSNINLLKAESPGPSVSKLVPKVKTTAKLLYGIYIVLTVTEIVLLLLGGLDMFEALTLTFGTVGTGGFAVKNSGLADYSSYVQNVISVFMILCGIDFTFYYLLFMRKIKSAFRMEEVRTYLLIILSAVVLITLNCYNMFENLADALKHVLFQVASVITTTGYSTTDFNKWPEFSKFIMICLMFSGACAGSTGGGIKVSRIMILFKSIVKEIKILAHPKRLVKITMNKRIVEHETVRAINVFMAAYLAILLCSVLLISLDNFDFTTNFTATVATLNNIGPGLSKVGPMGNFGDYSYFSKLILTFNMLIGRLEIFPMLVLFAPKSWKK